MRQPRNQAADKNDEFPYKYRQITRWQPHFTGKTTLGVGIHTYMSVKLLVRQNCLCFPFIAAVKRRCLIHVQMNQYNANGHSIHTLGEKIYFLIFDQCDHTKVHSLLCDTNQMGWATTKEVRWIAFFYGCFERTSFFPKLYSITNLLFYYRSFGPRKSVNFRLII